MYLSRVELDQTNREMMRALGSPQVLHAVVENCFGHKAEGERHLWRIDSLNDGLILLIQSDRQPSFEQFTAQFGDAVYKTWEYGSFLNCLQNGQTWHFRIAANPTKSAIDIDSGSSRGKVVAHVTVNQQKEWLLQRSEKCGFMLLESDVQAPENALEVQKYMFDVVSRETMKFRRGNKTVTLAIAAFEGLLTITDADTFVETIKNGIGRAKAYGCGLLTLARVHHEQS